MTHPLLPTRLALLYAALPLNEDVTIDALHDLMFPEHTGRTVSFKQNCLGPYVTKLNRRLDGQAVRQGQVLRRSYRLVNL